MKIRASHILVDTKEQAENLLIDNKNNLKAPIKVKNIIDFNLVKKQIQIQLPISQK